MPDPNTANIDPFFEEPTLILTCDVLEPGDGKPYERDPRSLAKRAEAYLKSQRHRRRGLLRPGARVLHLRPGALERRHVGLLRQDRFRRSVVEHRREVSKAATRATVRRSRAATSRCRRSTASRTCAREMCLLLEQMGIPVEVHHHEVGRAGPEGARHQVLAPWCSAPTGCSCRSTSSTTSRTPTARPRPSCPSRSSATTAAACTCTSRSGRTARTCSPATATPACREFALYYIGGIIKHARALNAITNPGTNCYKRLVPGFEAPVKLAYSAQQPLGVDAHPVRAQPEGPPHRGALPGSHLQPVPRLLSAC